MYAGVTPPVAVTSVLISCGRTALQEPTIGKLSLFSLKPELYLSKLHVVVIYFVCVQTENLTNLLLK